jgi:hypothetical protein
MNPLTIHKMKTSANPTIIHNSFEHGPSNSSAARWSESSASQDCLATMIRNRTVFIPDQIVAESPFGSGDNPSYP